MRDNVYYSPEKFDLEPVDEIEYSSGSYEFDTRVVWSHRPTGRLLTARDSGCSCPTPFEDYTLESLEVVNLAELTREVNDDGYNYATAEQKSRFLSNVRKAIRAAALHDGREFYARLARGGGALEVLGQLREVLEDFRDDYEAYPDCSEPDCKHCRLAALLSDPSAVLRGQHE